MAVKLDFSHSADGSSGVKMTLGEKEPENFDYIAFVKYLFQNRDEQLFVSTDNTYLPEQNEQLQDMVKKLEEKAKGLAPVAIENGVIQE